MMTHCCWQANCLHLSSAMPVQQLEQLHGMIWPSVQTAKKIKIHFPIFRSTQRPMGQTAEEQRLKQVDERLFRPDDSVPTCCESSLQSTAISLGQLVHCESAFDFEQRPSTLGIYRLQRMRLLSLFLLTIVDEWSWAGPKNRPLSGSPFYSLLHSEPDWFYEPSVVSALSYPYKNNFMKSSIPLTWNSHFNLTLQEKIRLHCIDCSYSLNCIACRLCGFFCSSSSFWIAGHNCRWAPCNGACTCAGRNHHWWDCSGS